MFSSPPAILTLLAGSPSSVFISFMSLIRLLHRRSWGRTFDSRQEMEEEIAATPSGDFIRRASEKMELAVCSSQRHIHTHTDSHTTLTWCTACSHMLEDEHDVVFSSVLLCDATPKLLTSNQQNANMRTLFMCNSHGRKASFALVLFVLFVQFGLSYEAEQRERCPRWTRI